ncbi:hypothetical protein RRG08_020262 [Elysia crispata]|uniref:Uncharacterized protein n=1 Tax=Elysia crispata TaxID=231223 RepID=A0AAE0YY40_9GAST|nr:hypothetical protein RRG08_020262 [Elysia crispata]
MTNAVADAQKLYVTDRIKGSLSIGFRPDLFIFHSGQDPRQPIVNRLKNVSRKFSKPHPDDYRQLRNNVTTPYFIGPDTSLLGHQVPIELEEGIQVIRSGIQRQLGFSKMGTDQYTLTQLPVYEVNSALPWV